MPRPPNAAQAQPRMLDTDAAAAYLGLAKSTLVTDRCTRRLNIPHYKVGRAVRYTQADLDDWLAERRVEVPDRSESRVSA